MRTGFLKGQSKTVTNSDNNSTIIQRIMNYKTLNLRKVKKEDLIKSLIEKDFEVPTGKDKKDIQNIIIASIERGTYLIARNALILGLYFDLEETFNKIRKGGIFRYSKYTSKRCMVENLVTDILELNEKLGFVDEDCIKYLNSIKNLSNLHNSYTKIHEFIQDEINFFKNKYKGKSLIKTLLSYIDFLFLSNHYPASVTDLTEISSRNKEDICSAVSYLIYLISNKYSLNITDTRLIAEEYIKSGEIGRIIIAACFISDFKEFEILIDHFNYECIVCEDKLKIIPPFENFEKSIRIGYIREHLQYFNDFIKAEKTEEDNRVVSLEGLVDELNKMEEFKFFKYTESHNYPRYIVEIPEPIYDIIIEKLFKPDLLFKEEVLYLAKVFKEQLLNPDSLRQIKIRENFTLLDFIKIRRVFSLLYLLFTKQIFKNENIDHEVLLRSLIPVYQEEIFYNFIEKLTSTENINDFLDIVCWEPGLDILFDLQYHPIIFIAHHFIMPLTILVNSNSIRNLFASEYKQNNKNLFLDGSIDALVEKLSKSFDEAGIQNFSQTSIPNSDIDLLAIFEDTLFLFECKQSLHPVSTFDLRTTFDYINKAEKQLDYLNQEYLNGNLTDLLEKKYKIDLKGIKNIVSCVVLSNRLFNGNAFKYPIRYISEIENFLTNGRMRTNEGEFWLWKTDKLLLSDLIEYFSLNSKLVKLLFDSVSVRTLTYKLSNPPILFDSYFLSSEKAIPLLNDFTSKLRKVEG